MNVPGMSLPETMRTSRDTEAVSPQSEHLKATSLQQPKVAMVSPKGPPETRTQRCWCGDNKPTRLWDSASKAKSFYGADAGRLTSSFTSKRGG